MQRLTLEIIIRAMFVAAVQQTIVDEMPARRADSRLDERLDDFVLLLRAHGQGGYQLEKGRPVFAGMSAIQRNPEYFPEPLAFGPSAGWRARRSRTRGCRSAAACGAASARRSRRPRSSRRSPRCCGASSWTRRTRGPSACGPSTSPGGPGMAPEAATVDVDPSMPQRA